MKGIEEFIKELNKHVEAAYCYSPEYIKDYLNDFSKKLYDKIKPLIKKEDGLNIELKEIKDEDVKPYKKGFLIPVESIEIHFKSMDTEYIAFKTCIDYDMDNKEIVINDLTMGFIKTDVKTIK